MATLVDAARCGFEIDAARHQPASRAELVGPNRYVLDTSALIDIASGPTREITAMVLEQQRDTSWRVYDLESLGGAVAAFGGAPAEQLSDGVRLVEVQKCVGPSRIEVVYRVENNREYTIVPQDLFFIQADGTTIDLWSTRTDGLAALPPESTTTTWALAFDAPNAYAGGTLVMVAPDEEGSPSETDELPQREFRYPIAAAPFVQPDPDSSS
jgi:hypothetical protein